MNRPPLEVADIVRAQGNRFIENHCRWIHWTHRKVLRAIARCRTAALGGHRDQCPRCGGAYGICFGVWKFVRVGSGWIAGVSKIGWRLWGKWNAMGGSCFMRVGAGFGWAE